MPSRLSVKGLEPIGGSPRAEPLRGGRQAACVSTGAPWHSCLAGLACCGTGILLSSTRTIPYMNKCFLLCVDCCSGGQDRRPHQLAVRAVGSQRGSPVSPSRPRTTYLQTGSPREPELCKGPPPTFDQPRNTHPTLPARANSWGTIPPGWGHAAHPWLDVGTGVRHSINIAAGSRDC